MKLVANIISVLFHPLFIPTIGVYLLFSTPTESISFIKAESFYYFDEGYKLRLYSLLAVLTIAAPMLSMVVLKTGRVITSYQLENPDERKVPLFMMLVYLVIVIFQLFFMDPDNVIPLMVKYYILSIAAAIVIMLITINLIKLSWHTAALGSLLALMFVYLRSQINYNEWIIPSLCLLLGIVGTSRLILNQHKESEVYLGALLGFATTFIFTFFA
ncbi:MAG: hypothetical protein KDC84_12410 [Crocinitomicaceae bacterium]|nr:hypothetical protein [Crocinitomicaceae bacterium]